MILDKFYDDQIWALKYRPKTIDEIITSPGIKNQLQSILDNGQLLNMLLYGGPGTGKTTAAAVLADALDRETHYINGSFDTGIDVLRTTIVQFVSTMSWNGEKKLIIIDEADRATSQLQDALKSFIEEFSKSCNFIFISNHKNKIIAPLQSRLQLIGFDIPNTEINSIKKQFFERTISILNTEEAVYDKKVVARIVNTVFPDMRKTLTELQKFSQQDMLTKLESIRTLNDDIKIFFTYLKSREFLKLRAYIVSITDPQRFYSALNEVATEFIDANSLLQFCMLLSRYSYQSTFVVDPQVNMAGFISECLAESVKVKDNV